MPNFLNDICAVKKEEVARLHSRPIDSSGRSSPRRPFVEALRAPRGLAVIAEIKKASPSKGIISASFDPVAIARVYEKGPATAISVLTEEKYFLGSLSYLKAVRKAVTLPILRKDFIIDPSQVLQSAAANADAVLLIATLLGNNQLQELYSAAAECDIDPLIEVHSMKEAERVLYLMPTPQCIGINNRDLRTFETNFSTTFSIIKHLPSEITVVSESGIGTWRQAQTLLQAGVKAVLVGESLMRSPDPASLIKELLDLTPQSAPPTTLSLSERREEDAAGVG